MRLNPATPLFNIAFAQVCVVIIPARQCWLGAVDRLDGALMRTSRAGRVGTSQGLPQKAGARPYRDSRKLVFGARINRTTTKMACGRPRSTPGRCFREPCAPVALRFCALPSAGRIWLCHLNSRIASGAVAPPVIGRALAIALIDGSVDKGAFPVDRTDRVQPVVRSQTIFRVSSSLKAGQRACANSECS